MAQTTVNQRLKILREHLKKQQGEFAEMLEIKQGSYSDVERGRVKLSYDLLEKVVDVFKVNPIWVMKGTEPMMLSGKHTFLNEPGHTQKAHPLVHLSEKSSKEAGKAKDGKPPDLLRQDAQIITVTLDTEGNPVIPILDIQAAAGWPQHINDPQYIQSLPALTMPWAQFRTGEYVLLQVSGDSMQPTIYNGDWLYCKRLYEAGDIKDGYIHVIITDDGVIAKRVLNRIDKRQALAVQSDNEQYQTYNLPIEQVRQIWKVEFKMSAILRNENTDVRKDIKELQKEIMDIKDRLAGR